MSVRRPFLRPSCAWSHCLSATYFQFLFFVAFSLWVPTEDGKFARLSLGLDRQLFCQLCGIEHRGQEMCQNASSSVNGSRQERLRSPVSYFCSVLMASSRFYIRLVGGRRREI